MPLSASGASLSLKHLKTTRTYGPINACLSNIFLFACGVLSFICPQVQGQVVLPDIPDRIYKVVENKSLALDIYYPKNTPGPYPLILWIHGGAWRMGHKGEVSIPLHMLGWGYALASIEYRLSFNARWPAQLEDIQAAVRYLRSQADSLAIDTSQIIAWGNSAGGHLSLMLGLARSVLDDRDTNLANHQFSTRIHAIINYFGHSNFMTLGPNHFRSSSSTGQLMGCTVLSCPDRARSASPIYSIDPSDPPVISVHGILDPIVPYTQAVELDSQLLEKGVTSNLILLPKAEHGGPEFIADTLMGKIVEFLQNAANPYPDSTYYPLVIMGDPENSQVGSEWTYTSVEEDGKSFELSGTFFKPRGTGPFPMVLLNHGLGKNAKSYGRQLGRIFLSWGYAVVSVNFTHAAHVPCGLPGPCQSIQFGASQANLARLKKTFELMTALPFIDSNRVVAFGHGRGAFVTTAFAAQMGGRLRAAAHTAGGVVPNKMKGVAPGDSVALKINIPYQIHHGSADLSTPLSYARRLDSLLEKRKIPHAYYKYKKIGNSEMRMHPAMLKRVKKWFANYTHKQKDEIVLGKENLALAAQFYPNLKKVKIRYALKEVKGSKLLILNLKNKVVKNLYVREKSGSLDWDGYNLRGQKQKPGVYIVQLRSHQAYIQVLVNLGDF